MSQVVAKVSQRKKNIVKNLVGQLDSYSTVGIVQMNTIGAKTVQKLRADLRSRAKIVSAKNTLMRRALLDSKVTGKEDLVEFISGPCAFLFTNFSPYQIANYLNKNKVKAPAKAGQIAPTNVIVPKMNTGFPPGTIITELNSVGLPTKIEGGTVAVSQDTQVIQTGDKINVPLASILTRLGIEPFLVGLSLDVVLENGEIIEGSSLIVDFDEYKAKLIIAHQLAVNLSVNSGFLTEDTASLAIATAHRKTLALAASIGYVTKDTASAVFGRAHSQMMALARAIAKVDKSAIPAGLIN
ncbi:MAG: 50S ribosomal protein L10 [Candidatus Heimdallarchaeota archaeon]|nr:50S ribosomal protein L10 [Candidatus Heimdallarchaeota archaeon]MDH5644617.1 50S ribosomal protein L10 [Candidatus Heimdallarchaeota archaeon]